MKARHSLILVSLVLSLGASSGVRAAESSSGTLGPSNTSAHPNVDGQGHTDIEKATKTTVFTRFLIVLIFIRPIIPQKNHLSIKKGKKVFLNQLIDNSV